MDGSFIFSCYPTVPFRQSLSVIFLCRFSQFFVKPLMSSDAVKREIKAVDSGDYASLQFGTLSSSV